MAAATMTRRRTGLPVCQPRWATPRTRRLTHGARVAELAAALGKPLMPWQRQVLDVALEVDPTTGRLVYDEVRLTVPRQSGKTTLLLPLMIHRALLMGSPQRIVYTAQTAKDARQKWEDEQVPMLMASPLKREVRTVRRTNGAEAIKWRNGSIHEVIAPTQTAGHGKTLDLAVIDEAFSLQGDHVEQALKPTTSTRPEPQFWVVSTAGRPESSPYLWAKVEDGRARAGAGVTSGVAYFEWSAPEDASPSDEDAWRACMPALGHTVTLDRIRGHYETMREPEFRRAYLNQWFAPASESVIPAEAWLACADGESAPVDPVAFCVDVSPDRSSAAIGLAALRSDGLEHVEVVEHRQGTGWVGARLVELVERWSPLGVVVDPAAQAGSFLGELPGLPWKTVGARDVAQACGGFYDAVIGGRVRHRGDKRLDVAVEGASKRNLAETWAWSRKNSAVDICPLVAVTLARWLLVNRPAEDEATAEPFVLFG